MSSAKEKQATQSGICYRKEISIMFIVLGGGLLVIIIAVIVAVVSSVVSAVAADQDVED